MSQIILLLFYLLFPALLIYLSYCFSFIGKIGPVILSYIIGIVIGNIGILPAGSDVIQNNVAMVTIPVALPLLLFSMDIQRWSKLAGKTLLSLVLGIISVIIVVSGAFILFKDLLPDSWKIGGMLIGVYTGGTPNLAAIKTALGVDPTTYIMTHTYDTILSTVYIIFLMTIAQRLFLKILPRFKHDLKIEKETGGGPDIESESLRNYGLLLKKENLPSAGKVFLLAVLIFGLGGGTSLLVPKHYSTMIAILSITTLGIAASFIPSVRKIDLSFPLGMYIIIIFCLDVATMAKMDKVVHTSPYLFYFVTIAIFGSLFLHLVLSAIFKIDADTTIITSTSLICSPPFVPVVAESIKNREVIISGLITGIIGYAIGNYLGIFLAYLFHALL